jgi:putative ABC transport system permease protein
MIEIIRNMLRRRGRTVLTVFGITIGIFAFVVMGSMAEKISLLVSGGTKYYSDKVTVVDGSGSTAGLPMPMNVSQEKKIANVPGVKAVTATVYTPLSEIGAVNFGPPPAVAGSELNNQGLESFKVTYSSGRELQPSDRGKVVVGSDLVKKLNAKVGGTITVKGSKYTVVGILNKTLTAPDTEVWMTLPDAQAILYQSLPDVLKSRSQPSQLVNGFTVYPDQGQDLQKLANRINDQVPGVKATGPQAFQDQIASATGILNAILFGIALISLLVGGLSIINTMTMAISERTREIGIKKAVGAKTRNIFAEYLTEAGLIGLIGGLIGWSLGALLVLSINQAMANSGNIIFLLSWRISIFAIVFSVVLGIIAGIYPARYAVKVNIVRALRES